MSGEKRDDPNHWLSKMRSANEAAENAVTEEELLYQYGQAAGAAIRLDRLLVRGGPLPSAWQGARQSEAPGVTP
jgi:hypothetical protein